MLQAIGCTRIEELFDQIPEKFRLKEPVGVGDPVSEPELLAYCRALGTRNASEYLSFLGAGAYSHFIPVIIDPLISRSEFFTAYTPYQPEISQGRLEALLNFQTMVMDLTGMEIANASLLDEGTAAAEAMTLSYGQHKRKANIFWVSNACHPQTIDVVQTRARPLGIEVMVGDHRNDLLAARDAGVASIYARFGYGEEDHLAFGAAGAIASFAELPGAVEAAFAAPAGT